MKSVVVFFFICLVAKSQVCPARLVLTGDAGGSAGLDEPIIFEILGAPIELNGGASAKGHGEVHLGKKSRSLILSGSALGNAGLDEPIIFEILGAPIELNGGASAKGYGKVHLGRNAEVRTSLPAEISKKALILSGNALGNAGLDEPIIFEILGAPIELNGAASAKGYGKVQLGRTADVRTSLPDISKKALVLSGNALGNAGLDRPIILEILGVPIQVNGGGSAKGYGKAYIGN